MGVRNLDREVIERLNSKTLDARFLLEIEQGLDCAPLVSKAILGIVREVYFPFIAAESGEPAPGKITLIAVAVDEPAGKPIADCNKQTVCLTLHRGNVDDLSFHHGGPAAFRRARILDLCQQALSQGALLTAEDLAYRVFFVTPRTISRDLKAVRKANPDVLIPMRVPFATSGRCSLTAFKSSSWHSKAKPPRRSARSCATLQKPWPIICPLSPAVPSSPPTKWRSARSPSYFAAGLPSSKLILTSWPSVSGIAIWNITSRNSSESDHAVAKKKSPAGGPPMNNQTDFLRRKFGPLKARSLKNAIANQITTEFPRIGGPRICSLCAELIMEVVEKHMRSRDHITHGQTLWAAIDVKDPPKRHRRTADTKLVPVLLDLSTADDVQRRIDRVPASERLLHRARRLCEQAHAQGGLLSNCDIAEMLHVSSDYVGQILAEHERSTNTIIPRRATLHDVGSGITHKRIICRLHYAAERVPTKLLARPTTVSKPLIAISANMTVSATAASRALRLRQPLMPSSAVCGSCSNTSRSTIC